MASARQNLLRTVLLVAAIAAACGRSDAAHAAVAVGEPGRGGALVASVRSDASTYNRHVAGLAATDLVSLLTQARLVRVNRATDELEPWLAESWRLDADNLTVHASRCATASRSPTGSR